MARLLGSLSHGLFLGGLPQGRLLAFPLGDAVTGARENASKTEVMVCVLILGMIPNPFEFYSTNISE